MTDIDQPLEQVDARLKALLLRSDLDAAAAVMLTTYGADLFGFLIGVLEDVKTARLVYAEVCARVASELQTFRWRCSPRVWLYSLARRHLRDRRDRKQAGMGDGELPDTEVWRRAGMAAVIAAVRRALSEEERELLILRVDRVLDWDSLAITQLGDDAVHATVTREAQELRQRIETLFARIQRLTALHFQKQS